MRHYKREYWRRLIIEQEASGLSMKAFCEQRGVSTNSLYRWHSRLAESQPVRFAELKPIGNPAPDGAIEIILASGDHVRINNGVDAATLRLVLQALRPEHGKPRP